MRNRTRVAVRRPPRKAAPARQPVRSPLSVRSVLLLAVVAIVAIGLWTVVEAPPWEQAATAPQPTPTPDVPRTTAEERALLVRVDKDHALAQDNTPPDLVGITGIAVSPPNQRLRPVALEALQQLATEAQKEGYALTVSSAYRSYAEQESTYSYWASRLGPVEAGRISARAGHSEHQLGTTVDLTSASVRYQLVEAFGSAPEGKWLVANAHRFGFVMSYPDGKEGLTGYAYEPWHWRYVGETTATWLWERGLTLTEWLREGVG